MPVLSGIRAQLTGNALQLTGSDTDLTIEVAITVNGETYPRGGGFDPHVLFDRRTNRFFATAMDRGTRTNNQMVLAVSRSADPTGKPIRYQAMCLRISRMALSSPSCSTSSAAWR